MKVALVVAALASGLIAGGFFAFSTFVMRALGQVPPPEGIRAMQAINVVVVPSPFVILLVTTALGCVGLAIAALLRRTEPGAMLIVAASVTYFAGTFLVTMLANVPLNDALAAVDANSAQGATLWADYLVRWTMWNHVRGLAALIASGLFIAARLAS